MMRKPSNELLLVLLVLLSCFGVRLWMALQLDALGVFAQYDILFDADSLQYLSALSNGWSFGRVIHPGFALFFNLPLRALDAGLAVVGLLDAGTLRQAAAIAFAPLVSTVGGLFWWLALRRLGLPVAVRLAGVLLMQLAFSQTVFSVIPESYAASGALLSMLFWLVARAAAEPSELDQPRIRLTWIALACVLSGVTVTNGFLCIAAWVALRVGRVSAVRIGREAALSTLIVCTAIVALVALDRIVYRDVNEGESSVRGTVQGRLAWASKYPPESVMERLASLPAGLVASVVTPRVAVVPIPPEKPEDPHRVAFSLEGAFSAWHQALAWLLVGGLVWRLLSMQATARVAAVMLMANSTLHVVFGRELFLYSQHWLVFLVAGVVLVAQRQFGQRTAWALMGLALVVAVCDLQVWQQMLAVRRLAA